MTADPEEAASIAMLSMLYSDVPEADNAACCSSIYSRYCSLAEPCALRNLYY